MSEALAWKVDVFVGGFCGAISMHTWGGGTARRKLLLGGRRVQGGRLMFSSAAPVVPSLCRPGVVALRVGSYGLVKACPRFMLVASRAWRRRVAGAFGCGQVRQEKWLSEYSIGAFCGALSSVKWLNK